MGIISRVRSVVGSDTGGATVRECRHCGTTVETDADSCPCCDRSKFVEFEIQ